MRKQKRKAPIGNQDLYGKVLAANFSEFPGDISRFGNGKLGAIETDQIKALEERLATQEAFAGLEEAFDQLNLRPADRKARFLWFCLVHLQNSLRLEEIQRLRRLNHELFDKVSELRDKLSEGAGRLVLKSLLEGKGFPSPEQHERARHEWRVQQQREAAERAKREVKNLEKQRRRSGRPGCWPRTIDWTQPHTAQEYVDAFCDKAIHKKRVREFLHHFGAEPRRRGRGRNKPLEYPYEAGLALYKKAVADWLTDDDKRALQLLIDAFNQVTRPTAITPAGLRFREVIARLVEIFPLQKFESVLPDALRFVKTKDDWQFMHNALRAKGFKSEQFL